MRVLASALIVIAVSGCSWPFGRAVIDTAQDVSTVEKCAQFQEVKNRLHRRLKEISTPNLKRLGQINKDGAAICTLDIDELTSELLIMEGDLP